MLYLLCSLILAGVFVTVRHLFLPQDLALFVNAVLIGSAIVYKILITAVVWLQKTAPALALPVYPSTIILLLTLLLILGAVFIRPVLLARLITHNSRRVIVVTGVAVIAIFILAAKVTLSINYNQDRHDEVIRESEAVVSRPNIILISFDALTAEDMSLYGYYLPTTPSIDNFASQCYVFDQMYANSNFTNPGIASIATGKYPLTSKVYNIFSFLPDPIRQENIGNVLRSAGYQTIAIFANSNGHPNQIRTYQDFDRAPLIDYLHTPDAYSICSALILFLKGYDIPAYNWFGERLYTVIQRTESFISWIERNPGRHLTRNIRCPATKTFTIAANEIATSRLPFFLWVHLFPPHNPYLPEDSFRYSFLPENIFDTTESQKPFVGRDYSSVEQPLIDKLRLRYDEHIASADAAFGAFLDLLKKQDIFNKSVIVITSDHGELFEKGYNGHGGSGCQYLYQPLIHIPLLIHFPGQSSEIRISEQAEQVDIAPTILDIVGIAPPSWIEGESLKNIMLSSHHSEKPKFAMNLEKSNIRTLISDGSIAVMKDGYKYIYYLKNQKTELFDLKNDPQEKIDLSAIRRDVGESMQRIIYDKFGRHFANE